MEYLGYHNSYNLVYSAFDDFWILLHILPLNLNLVAFKDCVDVFVLKKVISINKHKA